LGKPVASVKEYTAVASDGPRASRTYSRTPGDNRRYGVALERPDPNW
jgi:hypothetical protein